MGTDVGSFTLRYRLPELRPRLHVFGHIHEARGASIHTWDSTKEPPKIQNAHQTVFAGSSSESIVSETDPASPPPKEGEGAEPGSDDVSKEEVPNDSWPPRSTFVNAAAWPMGPAAYYEGTKVGFGGYGFQPVVVDLKN